MEVEFLSLDEILEIHEQQIERYGGTKGLRAFLLLNDWELTFNEDEFVELVLSVAVGQLAKPGLIRIFESGCKPLEEA
jgi:prophage maintenance system killer protein